MLLLDQLTEHLRARRDLDVAQVHDAIEQLVQEAVPATNKAELLTALARKGETPAEIAAFARELRDRALQPQLGEDLRRHEILDVVGTGGDRLSTFNISTTVAILCSAAGVLVAKHGNRASTSPVGSADVMEALAIPFDMGPEQAVEALRSRGFTYFYAPRYHPAFKHIIPARKLCGQSGQTTIFNFLGPLLNPARPSATLIGVPRPELCQPLAQVLRSMGVRRAMVVCGAVQDGEGQTRFLDELSPLGPTTIAEFYQERGLSCSQLFTEAFPLQKASLADLHGGDAAVNAGIIRAILDGTERGPKLDAVLLNASAALFVAGRVQNMSAGWDLAGQLIREGAASRKYRELSGQAA